MKKQANLTVQRVALPPEQVESWRAAFTVLLELYKEFEAERRALPDLEGEEYVHMEG